MKTLLALADRRHPRARRRGGPRCCGPYQRPGWGRAGPATPSTSTPPGPPMTPAQQIRHFVATDPGAAADAAWAAADTLHAAASALGNPELSRAADTYDCAARCAYGRLPRPTPTGTRLRTAARILTAAAIATGDPLIAQLRLILQLAALAEAVIDLRTAQRHAAQAAAAQTRGRANIRGTALVHGTACQDRQSQGSKRPRPAVTSPSPYMKCWRTPQPTQPLRSLRLQVAHRMCQCRRGNAALPGSPSCRFTPASSDRHAGLWRVRNLAILGAHDSGQFCPEAFLAAQVWPSLAAPPGRSSSASDPGAPPGPAVSPTALISSYGGRLSPALGYPAVVTDGTRTH